MKIPHKIASELKAAFARIIQSHPIKEFGCLCFDLDESGCRIRAVNFEESLAWQEGRIDDKARRFLIDFKHFKSLVETMKKDMSLQIEIQEGVVLLTVLYAHGGGVPIRLPLLTGESFPAQAETQIELRNCRLDRFLTAFQEVAVACARTDDRGILNSVLVAPSEGQLVATDGKRLLLRKTSSLPDLAELLLPVTRTLKSSLLDGESGKLGSDGRFIVFEQGPWSYRVKQPEGKFPRYHQVIPTSYANELDLRSIRGMGESLKRLFLLDPTEEDVVLSLHQGCVRLLAKGPQSGIRQVALGTIPHDGEVLLSFDRHFIAEGLQACGDQLLLKCGDARHATLFETPDRSVMYLVMPKKAELKEFRDYLEGVATPSGITAPSAIELPPSVTNPQSEEKAMSPTNEAEIPTVSVKVESEESRENAVQKDGLEAIYDKIEKLIEKQQEARKGLVEAHRAVHSTEFQLKLLIKDLKAYERGQNRRLKEVRKVEELISSLHKAA